MTATQHPPVGLVPPPPPAPTAEDGARWLRTTPAEPTVQDAPAQPQPQAQPATQAAPAQPVAQTTALVPTTDDKPAKRRRSKQTVYAWIVGVPLAGALGWAVLAQRGDDTPKQPSELEQLQATVNALATNVSTLAAGPSTATTAVETNPLNAMPCAVTNDAKRFIGVDGNGALFLTPSVTVSRQVYELIRTGSRYEDLLLRTGVSITQLEVAPSGRGVALFDCGAPPVVAAPTAPAPTTVAAAVSPQPGA